MLSHWRSLMFRLSGPVFAACLLQGCTTVPSDDERTQAGVLTDIRNMQEDINTLRGRQDHIDAATEELRTSIRSMSAGDVNGKAAMEKRLSAMEMRIKAIDEAREADKKDIIEKLSQRIADVINGTRSRDRAPAGDGSSGATRHVVKEKESLSQIAQKYGVSVNALIEANHLKNANVVRVGQTLVIPR